MTQRRWLPALLLGLTVTLLAGCSTTRVVEGQVQSFSTLAAVPAPATYRIERLPSQQAPSFDPIATLAEQALARAGLQRDDAAPRLLVQLGVQADAVPRYDPFRPYGPYGPGPWGMGGWYGRGWGVHGVWRFGEPTPLHRRAVSIVMRDENKCNIKTKRDKDRALCDRLLARWGLVKEIGNEEADDTSTD